MGGHLLGQARRRVHLLSPPGPGGGGGGGGGGLDETSRARGERTGGGGAALVHATGRPAIDQLFWQH